MVSQQIQVLHVDDDSDFADLADAYLRKEDNRFDVETATSADEGLKIINNRLPDCVVSDYNMPGTDGLEFLQTVREDNPDLPFILFTGKGSEEVASDAISANVTDYLQKGTGSETYELLANRIRNAVRTRRETKRADRQEQLMRLTEFTGNTGGFELDRESDTILLTAGARRIIKRPDQTEIPVDEVIKLFHPDDREEIRQTLNKAFEVKNELQDTWRLQLGDGDERLLDVTITPVVENGEVTKLRGAGNDITERKQRMQEIQTLKERLELAVEGANLGVWDWDMTTDGEDFNDQWAEMLGHTLEDIEPHLNAWEKRVHPDDIDEAKAELDAHIQQETDYYDTEHRMRTADGEWKWIRNLGKIVERDTDGEPIRAVGIHLDIDESKQYQWKLEEKTEELEDMTARLEEQYQTLFEESPVMGVVTRAKNGRPIIKDCNNQFAETLGFEPDALAGTELAEFYTSDSREELIDDGGYERSLEGDFTKESRELVGADGEIVETVLRAVPQRDASDTIVGTLAMYIDITEREEVKRANERLEEFAGIVSHDLRNPLNVAEGRLELAQGEYESEHLEQIEKAHDRMDALIEDLLTLAQEGTGARDYTRTDLSTLIDNCWAAVETNDATLAIDNDRTVLADRSRLKQLCENLIRNTVEHGEDDVTVRIGELDDGFYIEDDGPGIPDDEREDVFDAGYSTSDTGTGLGLSIVKQVVDAHGWDIHLTESSEGGTRFEITSVKFSAD